MKLLNKIPSEVIINIVEPYTRKYQSKELIDDIRSYHSTLNIIFFKYYHNLYDDYGNYFLNNGIYEKIKVKVGRLVWYFLELDILIFMLTNNLLPNLSTIIDNAYSRVLVETIQDEYTDYWLFDIMNEYKKTKKRVCLMWGKLNNNERLYFIQNYII
uniref:Uncharacterized protein n=1 Tax=viral metagenome TaxID=1070528 RepID=A0A6C0L1P8_9ZZZZ|tara:strand:+ start:8486 stop:8956 length:471 start_codon:yes stop_codon:yes gene_type:complete